MNYITAENCQKTIFSGANFLYKKTPLIATVALAVLSITPAYRMPAALLMKTCSLYVSGRLLLKSPDARSMAFQGIKITAIALGIIGIYLGGVPGILLMVTSLLADLGSDAFQFSLSGEKPNAGQIVSLGSNILQLLVLSINLFPIPNARDLVITTRTFYRVAPCILANAAIFSLITSRMDQGQDPKESLISAVFDSLCYATLAVLAWNSSRDLESHIKDHYKITADKTTAIYDARGHTIATLEPGKHDLYFDSKMRYPLFGEGLGRMTPVDYSIDGSSWPVLPTIPDFGQMAKLEKEGT